MYLHLTVHAYILKDIC